MLEKLERRFGRWAIPNLTLTLTIALAATFGLRLLWPDSVTYFFFYWPLIRDGELWRLISYVILAPPWHPLFAAFGLYLFYLMGNALEQEWGDFRYTLFVIVGWLLTTLMAILVPGTVATNEFLLGSVFLAFAFRYPDFQIYLFFILPVKIKWLALLTWLVYAWTLLTGSWSSRVMVLAATANFFLFFGREILSNMRAAKRRMEHRAATLQDAQQPFHRCQTCGATEKTHPDLNFFVCDDCPGHHEYCERHIHDHPHQ